MYENFFVLGDLQELGRQIFPLVVVFFVLSLGISVFILLASERSRAKSQEVKSLRKYGHKPPKRKMPTRRLQRAMQSKGRFL